MSQSKNILTLTEKNFDENVLESRRPVVVDFWADWCGPCRAVAPLLEELASEFSERATVAKLNVDEAKTLASQYGIRSIPSLLFFQDGRVVDRVVGVASREELASRLDRIVAKEGWALA